MNTEENKSDQIIIKKIEHTDEFIKVSNFFEEVSHNKNLDKFVLSNEYCEQKDNYSSFYYACIDDEVCGTLGVISFDIVKNEEKFKTLMLERCLVSPKHRDKKIFKLLQNTAYNNETLNDISFIWSLTPLSDVFIKSGYEVYNCLSDLYIKMYDNINISIDKNITFTENKYSEDLNEYSLIREFINKNKDVYFMYQSFNKLDWLIKTPNVKRVIYKFFYYDKFIGYVICRIFKSTDNYRMRIEDFIIIKQDLIMPIISIIINIANGKNIESMSFLHNKSNYYSKIIALIMEKIGFEEKIYPANFIIKSLNGSYFDIKDLYINASWSPPYWASP